MSDERDWLEVTLDSNTRRSLAEQVETRLPGEAQEQPHLLRMLRSSRNELLLDRSQGRVLLEVLQVDNRMSTLRARLDAFIKDV